VGNHGGHVRVCFAQVARRGLTRRRRRSSLEDVAGARSGGPSGRQRLPLICRLSSPNGPEVALLIEIPRRGRRDRRRSRSDLPVSGERRSDCIWRVVRARHWRALEIAKRAISRRADTERIARSPAVARVIAIPKGPARLRRLPAANPRRRPTRPRGRCRHRPSPQSRRTPQSAALPTREGARCVQTVFRIADKTSQRPDGRRRSTGTAKPTSSVIRGRSAKRGRLVACDELWDDRRNHCQHRIATPPADAVGLAVARSPTRGTAGRSEPMPAACSGYRRRGRPSIGPRGPAARSDAPFAGSAFPLVIDSLRGPCDQPVPQPTSRRASRIRDGRRSPPS
jgi:hypothetical protein